MLQLTNKKEKKRLKAILFNFINIKEAYICRIMLIEMIKVITDAHVQILNIMFYAVFKHEYFRRLLI